MVSNYVGAFFDILGQTERLNKIPMLLETSIGLVDKWKDETFNLVKCFRESFFKNISIVKTSKDSIITKYGITSPEIKLLSVSDSIFTFFSLHNDETAKHMAIISLYDLIYTSSLNYLVFLSECFPFRGAIEIGAGIEDDIVEIYGSVINNPYQLESKYADYPRIVIGKYLMEYLLQCSSKRPDGIFDGDKKLIELSKKYSDDLIELIVEDSEGTYFIDPLHESFLEICGENKLQSLAIKGYEFIVESIYKYKYENEKLHKKYLKLKQVFDKKIALWR